MLSKNNLAVKKVRGQSEATMVISDQNSDIKKLNILLRILLPECLHGIFTTMIGFNLSLGHLFVLSSFIYKVAK